MKALIGHHSKRRYRNWKVSHAADRRSWLANALLNSITVASTGGEAGDRGRHTQTARPPAFVLMFRRTRHDDGFRASHVVHAALLSAAFLTVIWLSDAGMQSLCDEGMPASSQCGEGAGGWHSGEKGPRDPHGHEIPRSEVETTEHLNRSDYHE